MRNSPRETNTRFFITSALLADLGLLFDNRAGGLLPNGRVDSGYNCYAKAFVTAYLARLQGLDADLHFGRGLMIVARGEYSRAHGLEPHAWVGLRAGGVIDLSVANFAGWKHFTTGHTRLPEAPGIPARTASVREFDRAIAFFPSLAPGAYLLFHERGRQKFHFDDLHATRPPINSPPTCELVSRFCGNPVLAKAVLHLHQTITGQRTALLAASQWEAWSTLAAWRVDAIGELEALWSAQGGRRVPARRAKRSRGEAA